VSERRGERPIPAGALLPAGRLCPYMTRVRSSVDEPAQGVLPRGCTWTS